MKRFAGRILFLLIFLSIVKFVHSQDFGCYAAPSSSSSFGLNAFSGYNSKMGLADLELPSDIIDGEFVRHYPAPSTGFLIVRDS